MPKKANTHPRYLHFSFTVRPEIVVRPLTQTRLVTTRIVPVEPIVIGKKVEKVEKVEKDEKVEKVEKIEKDEKIPESKQANSQSTSETE